MNSVTSLYIVKVRNVHDEWVKAPPIEGTILVNIGDLMQRWTSDRLIASVSVIRPYQAGRSFS